MMNKKIFGIRIIGSIFLALCATGISLPVHADGELFNVCFGREPAIQGKLYSYYANGGILNVLQVLKNGILVKKNDMFEGSIFLQEKIIFIKMNTRGLSDGSQVPVGQYRCTGTVTYEAVLGASRTVPAFAELSYEEKEQIYQEEKKAEKERKEREIKEQPERKKAAESIIGGVDLGMGCIRIEKAIAPSFEIAVKHFMWNRLVECKASGDWLGFLNAADDIVSNRLEPASSLKLFPDAKEVRKLCDALKKFRFVCELKPHGELLCLIPNWKWKRFIAGCKNSDPEADGIPRMTSENCFSHVPYVPEVVLSKADLKYGLAVLGDEPILIGGSGLIGKYNRSEYLERVEGLLKQAENHEIPLSAYKAKVLAMDNEAWRKIKAELIPIPHGDELERIRKADKDLRASKQLQARQEFVDTVSGLSFCLGDYILFQKGLLEYTHSVKMDEIWSKLSEFQKAEDWDSMARSVLGSSSDLSEAQQWVLARKTMLSHEFKFTIFFTRDTGYYQRRKNGWAWRSFCFDDCLEISQKLDVSDPVYVYTSDRGDALFEEAKKSEFNILAWLNSHPADMTDHHIGGEFRKKSWPNPRDISPLLKHKDDELNAAKADLSRFRRAVASVKWPPEYLVVTNVSVVGGKMVYTEKKKNFKIPQKVRGLALLLDNKDVVKLYGKYCGGLDLGGFKEEWKNAGKKQENVYKKYKLAFESTERAMLNALEAANPKARSGFGQPMSLEDIANRQSNYSMPINQEQPRSSVGKTAKHACDNCRGRKYVQTEVECPKCGGAGTTYTPAKKLIQGYSKPRTSQCSNCSGRGTVRKSVPCPNCNRN